MTLIPHRRAALFPPPPLRFFFFPNGTRAGHSRIRGPAGRKNSAAADANDLSDNSAAADGRAFRPGRKMEVST